MTSKIGIGSSIDAQTILSSTKNLPGPVGFLGTRSVLDSDVDFGLCRELTVGDGHVKEQVLPSLERRNKKRRSIPQCRPYAACVTFSSSRTGKKADRAYFALV